MSKGYDSKEHQQEEINEIRQTITEMESAFNAHDANELDRHFTLNATWVNVLGKRLSGWKQIHEAHKVLLPGPLRDSYACYTVESIKFIRSDVAIAHIRQYPTTFEGEIIKDGQGSLAIYVMVKEKETWKITAGQNTFVQ
ncbi:SgcJ/EcaC family oxidoreductase [Bacillus pseudomycoides]|uniref:SgcJ/EcaC family oxidoreductase n=1 Tax=Bacillus bingmayongensis TaxID=1150157 RepID=A0ABU5K1M5_9BACI|nr:SgcJ/EcaC family oxidoreductase [Bacillus pseudomycoides]